MLGSHRKVVALVFAVGLVAAIGAGCVPKSATFEGTTSGGATSEPKKGGTLSYYLSEAFYIDPYNIQGSEDVQVAQALFDSLTDFDPLEPEKLIPAAAESWESTASGKIWTFRLDKTGTFADGTPVKAQDFIYAWNRIASTKTKNTATNEADPSVLSGILTPVAGTNAEGNSDKGISGLKALDDYTLEVTLKYPFGDFEYVVAHPALAPVPRKHVEGGVEFGGKKVPFGEMPLGNGAFKMSEPWKHDQYIKVVANGDYYGQKPYIDGIDFMIFKDPDTAYAEFEAGTLDFTQIGEGRIKEAERTYGVSENGYTANPGQQVLLGTENSTYYLVCNLNDELMQNADLRKAISLAINREAICDLAFEGTRDPADNIVPPGIIGYEKGAWEYAKYDVAAAEKALADAGFPEGKGAPEIRLTYNNDGGHEKTMTLIQSDLATIGVKATFDAADATATWEKYTVGKFQIGRSGWGADYPVMDSFLSALFRSAGGSNESGYGNSATDMAIDAARAMVDSDARVAAYQDIDRAIGTDVPLIPIMFYKHNNVAANRVHDLTYSAMALADFNSVWLDAAAGK